MLKDNILYLLREANGEDAGDVPMADTSLDFIPGSHHDLLGH